MIASRHAIAAAALLAAGAAQAQNAPVEQGPPNMPEFEPAFEGQTRAPAADSGVTLAVETLAEGLTHPWGVATLPDGAILVTERPGRLRVIEDGALREAPVEGLPEVFAEEQGGLLDVAPGPDFADNRMIYWTYAKPVEGGSVTAAARGRLAEDLSEVTEVEDIFLQEPPSASPMHYGTRILFDGEGHAFVTTGERFTETERELAQDLSTTYGKVVRLGLDGSTPEDNPFVDREDAVASIWSYGHRNIQGAAFDPATGALWVAEHGPKGGDELNRIEPGANYGWPVVSYGENYDETPVGEGRARHGGDFVEPSYYWDPVIAPGGITFYDGELFPEWEGDLLIASLVPGAVVRVELDGDRVTGEERLLQDRGRVRDLTVDAEGALLVAIDAEDGALLRLTPENPAD